jgi:hypothetical protein
LPAISETLKENTLKCGCIKSIGIEPMRSIERQEIKSRDNPGQMCANNELRSVSAVRGKSPAAICNQGIDNDRFEGREK